MRSSRPTPIQAPHLPRHPMGQTRRSRFHRSSSTDYCRRSRKKRIPTDRSVPTGRRSRRRTRSCLWGESSSSRDSPLIVSDRRAPDRPFTTFPSSPCASGWRNGLSFARSGSGKPTRKPGTARGNDRRARNGPSDMEIGFKWQLIVGDKERKLIPTTALITSIFAPTGGGSSPYSSENVEPYLEPDLRLEPDREALADWLHGLYGRPTARGSRLGIPTDSYERYHQSLVGWYAATERTSFFYEWYILIPADGRCTRSRASWMAA